MFDDSFSSFSGFSAPTELRRQCNRSRRVALLNGDVIANSRAEQRGINARVFREGRCGFASSPEVDVSAAERILKQASQNAKFLADRLPSAGTALDLRERISHRDLWREDSVPQKDILDFLSQIDDYVKKIPHVVSRRVNCSCLSLEKELITTDREELRRILLRKAQAQNPSIL